MSDLKIHIGRQTISKDSPCFVIAEIGHNHQGNLKVAMDLIRTAANCGVQAVKFQKRHNKGLYTQAMYNKPYDNENSFGLTYGEHREFLEFNKQQYLTLKKFARQCGVEFMCTAFDRESVDFLEEIGIGSYKVASGDLTNLPLLEHIAKLKKPMFVSTGAASLEEVRLAYDTILKYNKKLCLLHTTCMYPADYPYLNLAVIETMQKEFPKALIGYSGHDNGILAAVIAYMLGAVVVEKHFTINRSWKGTDHKFSLEPDGLRKQVRDLLRVNIAMGSAKKVVLPEEANAKEKMGKSLYTARALSRGTIVRAKDIAVKSPAGGLSPCQMESIINKRLKTDLPKEALISMSHLEEPDGAIKSKTKRK